MNPFFFNESTVESAARSWLEGSDWVVVHGPDITPDAPDAELTDYGEVALTQRLRAALAPPSPGISAEALEDALRRLTTGNGSRWRPATVPSTSWPWTA